MACQNPISRMGPAGPIRVACKQCLPCRISKQSSLTLRGLLENHSALSGQFVTLTYADAPEIGGYKDAQTFLNRLRSWNTRRGNSHPVRYLVCGEYGTQSGRFHYHALLWNSLTPPKADWESMLWPLGFAHTGQVTPASIRYTVRYTLDFRKKGEAHHAGWSRYPPLGGVTMRALGEKYRRRGHDLPGPPTTLKMDGRTYPVDNAMRIEFSEGYNPEWVTRSANGTRRLASVDAIGAHLEYRKTMIEGDELMAKRLAWARRIEFQEKRRQLSGKL